MDHAFFLQKITGGCVSIFSGRLQMLWLRQGRRTNRPLRGEAKTEKARADAARTFSEDAAPSQKWRRRKRKMSKKNNRINVPEAREAMDKFKMEAANEVGVNLKEGYNGDISAREAGSVGGQMVKKMIESYEKSL